MQVDLGALLSSAQAALQGAAGAVLTPSLPELVSLLEQQPQAASSAAYYDSFVAGGPLCGHANGLQIGANNRVPEKLGMALHSIDLSVRGHQDPCNRML